MPPQGRGLWGKKKNVLELCSDECPTLGHQFPCQTTAACAPLLEQSGQLDSLFQKMQDRFFLSLFYHEAKVCVTAWESVDILSTSQHQHHR